MHNLHQSANLHKGLNFNPVANLHLFMSRSYVNKFCHPAPIFDSKFNIRQFLGKFRFPVNLYSSQFVLNLVNSYSKNGQFVLIWSIRTNSWSIRTHFGQFVLILVDSYSYSNEYELTKMSMN